MIFSAKNYASPAYFGKVMPKNHSGPFFLRHGVVDNNETDSEV